MCFAVKQRIVTEEERYPEMNGKWILCHALQVNLHLALTEQVLNLGYHLVGLVSAFKRHVTISTSIIITCMVDHTNHHHQQHTLT